MLHHTLEVSFGSRVETRPAQPSSRGRRPSGGKGRKREFGMSKCAVLTMEKGMRKEDEGIELPSGEVMKDVDEEGYKYLGVLQKDEVMSGEMKDKVKTEYFRRLVSLLKSQLYAGNLIAGINA